MSDDLNYCGCPKPRGDFAQGGWHMRRVPNDPEFARVHYGHESYAGTMVYVEQCPAYQAALAERILRDKRTKAQQEARSGGFRGSR